MDSERVNTTPSDVDRLHARAMQRTTRYGVAAQAYAREQVQEARQAVSEALSTIGESFGYTHGGVS